MCNCGEFLRHAGFPDEHASRVNVGDSADLFVRIYQLLVDPRRTGTPVSPAQVARGRNGFSFAWVDEAEELCARGMYRNCYDSIGRRKRRKIVKRCKEID